MKDTISVIVPVYNAEKFLTKCIESIINQTYPYLEIILVDDGSKDKSGQICDEYSKKDERIKVIHKENGGVSSARNVGLDNANGKYVCFVDADDWIEKDMYEMMISKLIETDTDVVRCLQNIVMFDKIKKDESIEEDELIQFNEKRNEMITNIVKGKIWPTFFLMLIKKEIIDEFHIRFDPELIIGEDLLFVIQIYSNITSMYWYRKNFYNYFINNQSAMNSNEKNYKMAINMLIMHKKVKDYLCQINMYNKDIQYNFANYIFYRVYTRVANQIYREKNKDIIVSIFEDQNYPELLESINTKVLSIWGKWFYRASKNKNVNFYYIVSMIYAKLKKKSSI